MNRFHQPQLLQPEGLRIAENAKRSSKPTPKKIQYRRVQFKETVAVRPIVHIDNMSKEDISATWFSKNDFDIIKRSFASTVRMLTYGELSGDDDEHCARGLEFRTRNGALERRENKWNALNATLDEQDRQRELGISNDQLLSQIYITENKHCRIAALNLGQCDAEQARLVYLEEPCDNDQMVETSSASDDSSDDEMDYCTLHMLKASLRAPSCKRTTSSSQGRQE